MHFYSIFYFYFISKISSAQPTLHPHGVFVPFFALDFTFSPLKILAMAACSLSPTYLNIHLVRFYFGVLGFRRRSRPLQPPPSPQRCEPSHPSNLITPYPDRIINPIPHNIVTAFSSDFTTLYPSYLIIPCSSYLQNLSSSM